METGSQFHQMAHSPKAKTLGLWQKRYHSVSPTFVQRNHHIFVIVAVYGCQKTVHKMFGEIDFRLSPTDLLQLPLKEMDLNLSLESLSKVFNP